MELLRKLQKACSGTDIEPVKDILQDPKVKDKINDRIDKDNTVLISSCRHGTADIVKLLLDNGAHSDVSDSGGVYPIHFACWSDVQSLEKVKILVEWDSKNVSLSCSSEKGEKSKPLHIAAEMGSNDVIVYLLSQGADVMCRTALHRNTPLHCAVIENRIADVSTKHHDNVIETLLGSAADVDAADIFGITPLGYTAAQNNISRMQYLIEKGAQFNIQFCTQNDDVREKRSLGLRLTAKLGSAEISLLDGYTALHLAAYMNHLKCVKILSSDPRCDIYIKGNDGKTAMDVSCADVLTKTGKTTLQYGPWYRHWYGANPNALGVHTRIFSLYSRAESMTKSQQEIFNGISTKLDEIEGKFKSLQEVERKREDLSITSWSNKRMAYRLLMDAKAVIFSLVKPNQQIEEFEQGLK